MFFLNYKRLIINGINDSMNRKNRVGVLLGI